LSVGPTGLDDRHILADALFSQKGIAKYYDDSILESATPEVRGSLLQIHSEEVDAANRVFQHMNQHGWYNVKSANQQEISNILSTFSERPGGGTTLTNPSFQVGNPIGAGQQYGPGQQQYGGQQYGGQLQYNPGQQYYGTSGQHHIPQGQYSLTGQQLGTHGGYGVTGQQFGTQGGYGVTGQQFGTQGGYGVTGQQFGTQGQYGMTGQQYYGSEGQYGIGGQQFGQQQYGGAGSHYGTQGQYSLTGQTYGTHGQTYGVGGQTYGVRPQQYSVAGQPYGQPSYTIPAQRVGGPVQYGVGSTTTRFQAGQPRYSLPAGQPYTGQFLHGSSQYQVGGKGVGTVQYSPSYGRETVTPTASPHVVTSQPGYQGPGTTYARTGGQVSYGQGSYSAPGAIFGATGQTTGHAYTGSVGSRLIGGSELGRPQAGGLGSMTEAGKF
jgi:hypothetical protein